MGVVVYKKEDEKKEVTSLVVDLSVLYGYLQNAWFLSVKDAMDHEGQKPSVDPDKLEKDIGQLIVEVKSKKFSHVTLGRKAEKLQKEFKNTESATLKEVADLQVKVAHLEEIKKTILATLSTLKALEKKYIEKHNPKVRSFSPNPEEGESGNPLKTEGKDPSEGKEVEKNSPSKDAINPSKLDSKLDNLVKDSLK